MRPRVGLTAISLDQFLLRRVPWLFAGVMLMTITATLSNIELNLPGVLVFAVTYLLTSTVLEKFF